MKSFIYKNVSIGEGSIIEDDVEIGRPGKGKTGNQKTSIGKDCHIRRGTIIYAGVTIGENVNTGHYALIREGNTIGNNVNIGSFTELALHNIIGDGTRIHSRCFLEDVTMGKNIFVGPNVLFTNDPHPPSGDKFKECLKGATVEDEVMIGGGVTVLPAVHIGKRALIGAGSVVVHNVPAHAVAVGNPARITKKIENIICRRAGKPHRPYATRVRRQGG